MPDLNDPSTLSDEELDKVLAGDTLEEEQVTPPADPPQGDEANDDDAPADPPAADELEEEDPPADDPEEEQKPPTRREQLRINKLLEKYGNPSQPAVKPEPVANALNYNDALDADPEVIKQLEDDRTRSNQAMLQQGLQYAQAAEWRTMLRVDTPAVQASHPQLNPRDEQNFHPVLTDALNNWYLKMSQYDDKSGVPGSPDMRYGEFIDGIYELAEEIAATKVQEARKNVVKQAAKTGLRPDGSSAKRLNLNKAPEDMTDEELDAYLAKNIPRR